MLSNHPKSVVERPIECVDCCGWRGAMIHNAARHKRQRAIPSVAIHSTSERVKTTKQTIDQHVNTLSERSIAEFRMISFPPL